ncbi:MAG: hypothetical protein ABIP78_04470 [Pyrinomonadaceae bacterium]
MTTSRSDWLLSAPVSATNARADTPLFPYLARLMRGENLSASDAAKFFRALTDAGIGSIQIASALTALTAKGQTCVELAGMASVMRSLAVKIKSPVNAVDIAGTGASAAKTFNISTASAFVVAGAGLAVAKQGNRRVTTGTGSADVLSELGVKAAAEVSVAEAGLRGVRLSFLSAAKFHPELRRFGDVRSRLSIRTCLNVLGLRANPASVPRQLIGVWHRSRSII